MKKQQMAHLGLAIVAIAIGTAPARSQILPFDGTRENVNPLNPPGGRCDPPFFRTVNIAPGALSSTGTSNVSNFSSTQSHCITSAPPTSIVDGRFTYRFEAGDTIFGTYTGNVATGATPGTFSAVENLVITGGTGRFIGASGTIDSNGVLRFADGNGIFNGTFSGNILAPTTTMSGRFSTALGVPSAATGEFSTSIGAFSFAPGARATALGSFAEATGAGSAAFGDNTFASGPGSVALGQGAAATAPAAHALGHNSIASGIGSTAVGVRAQATGTGAVSIGQLSGATADNAIAIGARSSATSVQSVAIGQNARATNNLTTAVGNSALATGLNATAVGNATQAVGMGASAFGNGAVATEAGTLAGGVRATASGTNSTALGGLSSATAELASAVGRQSNASGVGATALGSGASATAAGSVALGQGSVAGEANTVSLGTPGNERRVVNVAPGTVSTDAVNVGQLNAVNAAISGESMSRAAADSALSARMDDLSFDIRDTAREGRAGTAAALAVAGLPQAQGEGRTMIAGGVGHYRGRSALAIGASHRLQNGTGTIKLGVTYDSSKHTGANAGFGIEF